MEEIELPDGRVIEVGPDDDREAVRAKILQEFPELQTGGTPQAQEPQVADTPPEEKRGFVQNFTNGVRRIATGDVTLDELGREAETFTRAVAAPIGGDFVAAGAENLTRAATRVIPGGQNLPNNPNAITEQRERRRALANRSDSTRATALAGELLGFGGIQSQINKAPSLIVSSNASRAGNAARTAGQAGIVTGVGETAKTGDVQQGAEAGAIATVAAPVVGGAGNFIVKKVKGIPNAARSLLGGNVHPAAMDALARRTNVPADILEEQFNKFVAANNRPPALAEIIDDNSVQQMRRLAEMRSEAAEVFNEAEELFAIQRPGQLQAAIENGSPAQSAEALTTVRDDLLTSALRTPLRPDLPAVAERAVPVDEIADLLADPDLLGKVSRTTRRKIAEAVDGEAEMTIDLLDRIRQSVSKGIKGENGDVFRGLRDEIVGVLEENSPEYARAFERYRQQSQFIDGLGRGRGVRTASTADFEQAVPTLSASEAAGVSAGSRSGLAEAAGETPVSAVRVANDISQAGPQRRIAAAQGATEAERLAEVGRTNARAAQNFRGTSTSNELPPSLAGAPQDAGELLAVGLGRASPFAVGRILTKGINFLEKLGVPPATAKKIAELAVDPNSTQEAIEQLRRLNVADEFIAEVSTELAVTGAAAAASDG